MKNIATIFKREVAAYFNSAVAYIVVILFLVITGAIFWLSYFQELNLLSLRSFFNQAPLFLTFFVPAITMGLVAEEKRSGTLELLMTMPLRDSQIVIGKFLAAVFLLAVVFLMTIPYGLTLSYLASDFNTTLDWGATFAGYIGLLLLGSSYAAIGVMASSWTRDQIVAILLAFFISFTLFIIGQFASTSSLTIAHIIEYASTSYHFDNIARGVIDLRDVLYYLTIIGVSLVIAQSSIAARRW